MSLTEIIFTFFYILIFYFIIRYRSSKIENSLRKLYLRGFWLKMFAAILFTLYYTYLTGGDTRSLYFFEGKNLYHLLLKDSNNWYYIFHKGTEFDLNLMAAKSNFGYFQSEANFMVIRLTAICCFLSFGYYTPIGLIFALFAFSGLWRLFLFFYEQRPDLKKGLAISIIFFPSLVFWSSGLMKDSLCIGALGWMTYSLYNLLKGKGILRNTAIVFVSVYLLYIIKIYILLAYAPLFMLYLILKRLRSIRIALLKYIITIFIIGGIFAVFSQIYEGLDDDLNSYALENLASSVALSNEITASFAGRDDAESTFELGASFDGTLPGLVKIMPYALAATFFRPFIWETNKISQLMAAAESIVLVYFTLMVIFKAGPFRFFNYVISDPLILFCLLFAVIFGLFVGTSTLNFGTLVRYKIPCMPFYCIALYLLYARVKLAKKAKISNIPGQDQLRIA